MGVCVKATITHVKLRECKKSADRLAIGVLSEPASKSVFSASFGLSSSKGDSLTSFSAPKSSQKYLIFRSQNFKITKNFFEQDKNAGNPVGLSSILVKFTGIFVS